MKTQPTNSGTAIGLTLQAPTTFANARPLFRDYVGETDIDAYNARHQPEEVERRRRINLAKQRLAEKQLINEDNE